MYSCSSLEILINGLTWRYCFFLTVFQGISFVKSCVICFLFHFSDMYANINGERQLKDGHLPAINLLKTYAPSTIPA